MGCYFVITFGQDDALVNGFVPIGLHVSGVFNAVAYAANGNPWYQIKRC